MQKQSKDEILRELNNKCIACISRQQQNNGSVDYALCHRCDTGTKIHQLDDKSWDAIDWNSAKYKNYYGQ